jgi:hypothetical protein
MALGFIITAFNSLCIKRQKQRLYNYDLSPKRLTVGKRICDILATMATFIVGTSVDFERIMAVMLLGRNA